MDIERVVAHELLSETGITTVLEVPSTRPREFFSVELVGTSKAKLLQRFTLSVEAWAGSRKRAAELASTLEFVLYELPDLVSSVFRVEGVNTQRWPDPESKQARYQTTFDLIVCE